MGSIDNFSLPVLPVVYLLLLLLLLWLHEYISTTSTDRGSHRHVHLSKQCYHRVIVKLYWRPALMSVCSSGSPPSVYSLVSFDLRVI